MNRNSITHGLMMKYRICRLKESKLYYNGYRIQDKNTDNLHNIKCDTKQHFRTKKREYLKAKINERETNSNIECPFNATICVFTA